MVENHCTVIKRKVHPKIKIQITHHLLSLMLYQTVCVFVLDFFYFRSLDKKRNRWNISLWKKVRFGTAWGRVNDCRNFNFSMTITYSYANAVNGSDQTCLEYCLPKLVVVPKDFSEPSLTNTDLSRALFSCLESVLLSDIYIATLWIQMMNLHSDRRLYMPILCY